jgi:hypothetical protein
MKSVHESQILHMGRSASKILSLTEEEFYEVRLEDSQLLKGQWNEIFDFRFLLICSI